MIFVTHRFTSLAKSADLILYAGTSIVTFPPVLIHILRCMKEGKIVEQGTHEALVNIPDGEYAKLYRAQADGLGDTL